VDFLKKNYILSPFKNFFKKNKKNKKIGF